MKTLLKANSPIPKVLFRIKSIENSINRELEAPIGTNLAIFLRDNRVPLPFTCDCKCECGTCAIRFSSQKDFIQISNSQPIGSEEAKVLRDEGKSNL